LRENSLNFVVHIKLLDTYFIPALFSVLLIIIVTMFARFKVHTFVVTVLMAMFWAIITSTLSLSKISSMVELVTLVRKSLNSSYEVSPRPATGFTIESTAIYPLVCVLLLILLSVAPAKAVSRRLIFLALGLILLIALNELSKLGLDVTAPKLSG
jgi:hypothetical protein